MLKGLLQKRQIFWLKTKGQDGIMYSADHFSITAHGMGRDGFPIAKPVSTAPIVPAYFGRE
jgi:hypothetical protein